jgi:hypothetical protein
MFGKKSRSREAKRQVEEKRQAIYKTRKANGAAITKRIYELRQLDPFDRPQTVLGLLKDAKHQLALIRQSIADRSHYDFGPYSEEAPEADIATYLAEDITGVMRENTTNPQTFWQAMSEQFPEVYFTVDWYEATSMVAAMIREMHLAGVIEGLELAGALPDSTK